MAGQLTLSHRGLADRRAVPAELGGNGECQIAALAHQLVRLVDERAVEVVAPCVLTDLLAEGSRPRDQLGFPLRFRCVLRHRHGYMVDIGVALTHPWSARKRTTSPPYAAVPQRMRHSLGAGSTSAAWSSAWPSVSTTSGSAPSPPRRTCDVGWDEHRSTDRRSLEAGVARSYRPDGHTCLCRVRRHEHCRRASWDEPLTTHRPTAAPTSHSLLGPRARERHRTADIIGNLMQSDARAPSSPPGCPRPLRVGRPFHGRPATSGWECPYKAGVGGSSPSAPIVQFAGTSVCHLPSTTDWGS